VKFSTARHGIAGPMCLPRSRERLILASSLLAVRDPRRHAIFSPVGQGSAERVLPEGPACSPSTHPQTGDRETLLSRARRFLEFTRRIFAALLAPRHARLRDWNRKGGRDAHVPSSNRSDQFRLCARCENPTTQLPDTRKSGTTLSGWGAADSECRRGHPANLFSHASTRPCTFGFPKPFAICLRKFRPDRACYSG